jgi:hypothetical protein
MMNSKLVFRGNLLLGLIALASACVIETSREGYYDRDHHRYYHERGWHECVEHDAHCR